MQRIREDTRRSFSYSSRRTLLYPPAQPPRDGRGAARAEVEECGRGATVAAAGGGRRAPRPTPPRGALRVARRRAPIRRPGHPRRVCPPPPPTPRAVGRRPPPPPAPPPPAPPRSGTPPTARLRSFVAQDFLIRRPVASQGYVALTEWTYRDAESGAEVWDPTAPTRTADASAPAVRLYDATIVAPGPSRNTRVMLKEFLPGGTELGVAEAEAYEKLAAAADAAAATRTATGGAATAASPGGPPVATLLGSFLSDDAFASPDFRDSWRRSFPAAGEPPRPNTPWLVFLWEGNTTAASYLASTSPAAVAAAGVTGVGLIDSLFPGGAYRRRTAFLRAVLAGAAAAVAHLHAAGVTHRSLGLSSLLLNTREERLAASVGVKVRDFGFARPTAAAADDAGAVAAARAAADTVAGVAAAVRTAAEAEDVYALGVAAAELVFGALAGGGGRGGRGGGSHLPGGPRAPV
ncbi:hypothetical protein BU14_0275s0004 [Porphyra umbilicalis]|uniref:Protein kinase domain-containing protein n=1 Tax=Porphyra umbilicalis TaxID=2786 RepID=A0A1X6P1K4_PORUM|nr:hypothetical protein BU14_0275s0004 [Porphyra umbilicalis]|eukprot:OSX74645.1 hypothetical protein BU14_0275s0004 [Porphyra umbilicalis]